MNDLRLPPFDVTRAAIDEIESVGGRVRITLEPAGCCGSAYRFDTGPPSEHDERFGCPGAEMWVSPDAVAVLTGARLD